MSDRVERYWRSRDAKRYDSGAGNRIEAYQWMATEAKPHLMKRGAVSMDLGCGTGIFAKTVGVRDIIGIDISPPMLDVARTRMDTVYERNIFELHLEENSVDNIITLFVLADYPFEKKAGFLRQVYSYLRRGGRFFFSAYSPNDGYMGKRACERAGMRDGGGSFEVYLEDAPAYRNMLVDIGFRIEKIETIASSGTLERESETISFDREFIMIVAIKD